MLDPHEETTAAPFSPAGGDLTLADYRALAEFRSELRRFLRFSEEVTLRAGLEPQQHQLLLAIRAALRDDAATVGALADRLQLKPHSVVELVDRAAQRGLVRRERSEHDRRRVIVRLTPAGEQTLRRLALYHRDELCQAGPRLIAALRRIVEADRAVPVGESLVATQQEPS